MRSATMVAPSSTSANHASGTNANAQKRLTRSSSLKHSHATSNHHHAPNANALAPPPPLPLQMSSSSPTLSPASPNMPHLTTIPPIDEPSASCDPVDTLLTKETTKETEKPPLATNKASLPDDDDFNFKDRPPSTINATRPVLSATSSSTRSSISAYSSLAVSSPLKKASDRDTPAADMKENNENDDDDDQSTVFSPTTPLILEPTPEYDNDMPWPVPAPSLSESTSTQKGKKYWRKSSLGDISQSTVSLNMQGGSKKGGINAAKRRHSAAHKLSVNTMVLQPPGKTSAFELGPTSAPPINPYSLTRQMSHASSLHSPLHQLYPALLSRLAIEFHRRLPLRTLVKNDIDYPNAFSGKEAVDCLLQLLRTHDRNLGLVVGRSLGSQQLFHDVTYEHYLRDSQDKIYQFRQNIQLSDPTQNGLDTPRPRDPEEAPQAAAKKELPTGVFTLLTNCYSPTCRRGQGCYSVLCPRNEKSIKRSYSQSSLQEQEEKRSLWIQSVPKSVVDATSKEEIKRQECIYELIYTEADFVKSLQYVHNFWVKPLITQDIIPDEHREHFVQEVFWNLADIEKVNHAMLQALLALQKEQQTIQCIGDTLLQFVSRFDPFVAYGAHQVIGKFKFELEKKRNPLFAQFVFNTERLPESRRLELNGYLTKPTTRLGRYSLLLREILKRTPTDHPDHDKLQQVIDIITSYLTQVNSEAGKCENIFNLLQIEERLSFKSSAEHVDLVLRHPQRQLITQGRMKRKGNSTSDASDLQVFLFDHYLVFAKIKVFDHLEYFKVYRKPIPLDLLSIGTAPANLRAKRASTILPYNRQSTVHSSYGSLPAASTSETLLSKSSGSSSITFYHHGRKGSPPLTLHVSNATVRKTWVDRITQQQDRLMSTRCVFSMQTTVRRQFLTSNRINDSLLISKGKKFLVKREDDETDSLADGKSVDAGSKRDSDETAIGDELGDLDDDEDHDDTVQLMLVATDLGVYVSTVISAMDAEVPVLSEMKRVIPLDKATQIEVLDQPGVASQLLVLADKTLWSFPLDEIFDTVDKPLSMKRGHTINTNTAFFHVGQCLGKTLVCIVKPNTLSATTIRVLEPISTVERKSTKSTFSIRRLVRNAHGTGLKPYKDLYLPSEASSIRLLKSKMCISCHREIGVVDMKSFGVQALLDPTDPNLHFVFSRQDIHPITIFRVQFAEYLVCYDEFGFFVDQRGRLMQSSPILEWEGEPDAFVLSYPHVLAFEPGFIEVRNIVTGQVDQLIRGSNIRCTNSRQGMIQGAMNDPDHEGYQIIFQCHRM
ncbi:hypothetical protein BC940DRAFT_301167 [Gongronella butleri]|nr:hypothetical protein BC940DRAFT_301167 [Gongronella butleri]